MSVSEYKLPCSYFEEGLSNEIYLVSEEHTKKVWVDENTHAYISDLSETPMKIVCTNVELSEEATLDERYQFEKTLTARIDGYANLSSLYGKYYAIVKTKGGTLFMVNVDFPSDISYTYNLSENTDTTTFTFHTLSNFPSLRLNNAFSDVFLCKAYKVPCFKGLRLIGKENALYSNTNGSVELFGDTFKDVEYYANSLSFTESFNGRYVSTTLSFNLPLWYYKSYWHINLLEWVNNKYSAVIEGCNGNYIYAGFTHGLIPTFTITGNDSSSMITINLTETSENGSNASDVFDPQDSTATTWSYITTVDGESYFECVGNGMAKYILMAEAYSNGLRTGRYKALEGYENNFPQLNIVGTFSEVVTFPNPDCSDNDGLITDMNNVSLASGNCKSYSLSSSCEWNIVDIPNGFTVVPSSGTSGVQYTIEVCNVSAEVGSYIAFIEYCGKTKSVPFNSIPDSGSTSIQPKSVTIDCRAQNVTFTFDSTCPITVISIPSGLNYTLGFSTLVVSVPENTSTSARTFPITVKDCNGVIETVYIIQNGIYERWVEVDNEYICADGNKYKKERRYTGTTDSNYVPTDQYRTGALIESGSTDCTGSEMYRWYFDGRYYCDGTTKYKALLEQVSYDSGTTWAYTGKAKYGENMGEDTDFCGGSAVYTWSATTNYECYEHGVDYKMYVIYRDGTTDQINCNSNSAITKSEADEILLSEKDGLYGFQRAVTVEFGACAKEISGVTLSHVSGGTLCCSNVEYLIFDEGVEKITNPNFGWCPFVKDIHIPASLTYIEGNPFRLFDTLSGITVDSGNNIYDSRDNCNAVIETATNKLIFGHNKSTIPSTVTTIGADAFTQSRGLTGITIPNSVTTIEEGAFIWTGLKNIVVPDSVTTLGHSVFQGCESLTSVTMTTAITSLDAFTFFGCSSLLAYTIPSNVTNIGNDCFKSCTSLTSITCLASTPPTLGLTVFDDTNNCPIYVPAASVNAYKAATGWSAYSNRIQALT